MYEITKETEGELKELIEVMLKHKPMLDHLLNWKNHGIVLSKLKLVVGAVEYMRGYIEEHDEPPVVSTDDVLGNFLRNPANNIRAGELLLMAGVQIIHDCLCCGASFDISLIPGSANARKTPFCSSCRSELTAEQRRLLMHEEETARRAEKKLSNTRAEAKKVRDAVKKKQKKKPDLCQQTCVTRGECTCSNSSI